MLLVGCATTPHMFSPADDAAVRAVLTAQQAAWNRGDLDGFMAGYDKSPDLVFTSGGHIRHGWQETYDKYKAKYGSDRSTMGKLSFEVLGVQSLGADGAIVLGRWKLTETLRRGRRRVLRRSAAHARGLARDSRSHVERRALIRA